jgi:polysaccharide export outer membrane protein
MKKSRPANSRLSKLLPTELRQSGRLLATLLLAAMLSPFALQAQVPSQSQLEAFRNLPPDQQRAIMEQLGLGGSAAARGQQLEFPPTTEPKALPGELDDEQLERLREPRLRAGDTIVIDLVLRDPGQEDLEIEFELEKRRLELERKERLAEQRESAASGTQPLTLRTTPDERKKRSEPKVPERSEEELARLEDLRLRVLDGNPFKLNRSGMLEMPGVRSIALAGLTEELATKRLAIEPALRDFRVRVTLLPLEKRGEDALKPFGYDLFSALPTTFAPATDVPVPAEYVVGPGDTLRVQLSGATEQRVELVVDRNGVVQFPELGPIPLAGLRFTEARAVIEERVQEQLIGTRANVSIGELRSITIVVAGEAERPGAYTVSSLSTITNALFATGGVKEIGSLRNIQLKRNGRTVVTLDLYDLLLAGDSRNDRRLQSGDVIFIPPVGNTASVTGQIRRPAIYELKGESTAADLLYLAGGLTPEADPRTATLERIGERRERIVMAVDLTQPGGRSTPLRTGDLLRLKSVPMEINNGIDLSGHVQNPGSVAWRPGLRIADVLRSVEDLRPRADLNYVLIRREAADRTVSAISADLAQAWVNPASPANVPLQPRDRLYVFNLEGGRELQIKAFIEDLERQARPGQAALLVTVSGEVKAPGQYPLETGMTVSDLVRAGGGMSQSAYRGGAEITRYQVVDGQYRRADTLPIDLERALAGDIAADLPLLPSDFLVIKSLPQWAEPGLVTLGGEVRFPGKYPIKRGETLRSLLERAGGLTDLAYPAGSVFTRETLKEREAQQIMQLADRLQGDLAALALQGTQTGLPGQPSQAAQAVAVGQTLLDSLREIEPVGRLVIDLDRVLQSQPGSHSDIVLKDGDRLLVPERTQEVTVLGEVQSGTSHLWDPSLGRDDYIRLSGGTTKKADKGRIYIVRANGSVVSGGNTWFRSDGADVMPGDTIVVPLDAERMRPLPLWTAVTTIIYNLAVAVAAVNSF